MNIKDNKYIKILKYDDKETFFPNWVEIRNSILKYGGELHNSGPNLDIFEVVFPCYLCYKGFIENNGDELEEALKLIGKEPEVHFRIDEESNDILKEVIEKLKEDNIPYKINEISKPILIDVLPLGKWHAIKVSNMNIRLLNRGVVLLNLIDFDFTTILRNTLSKEIDMGYVGDIFVTIYGVVNISVKEDIDSNIVNLIVDKIKAVSNEYLLGFNYKELSVRLVKY